MTYRSVITVIGLLAVGIAAPSELRAGPSTPQDSLTGRLGDRSTKRDDTLCFGAVDASGVATSGGIWTFDHGAGGLEGWTSVDLTEQSGTYFRGITSGSWGADPLNQVPAPVFGTGGAAWVGVFGTEARALCWKTGLGHGNDWAQLLVSPSQPYTTGTTVHISWKHFCDLEDGCEYIRVYLLLNGAFDRLLTTYTGQIGLAPNHPSSPPVGHVDSMVLPSTYFGQAVTFQVMFVLQTSHLGSDEDGLRDTAYGPAGFDDVSLDGTVYNFETGLGDWTTPPAPPCGAFLGVHDIAEYNILDPTCNLDHNALGMHDNSMEHPPVQHVYAVSPPVDILHNVIPYLPGPGQLMIAAEWDQYADLPLANGVFYRPGAFYRPYTCPTTGITGWSPRVGQSEFVYVDSPSCDFLQSVLTDVQGVPVPAGAEQVRFVYEIYGCQACGALAECTGVSNFTPLLDNVQLCFSRFGAISGRVYEDEDSDCIQDGGERNLSARDVLLQPGNRIRTAATDGTYSFQVPAGTYTLTLLPRAHWSQTCPVGGAAQVVTLAPGEIVTGKDFGSHQDQNVQDLRVSLAAGRARIGFITTYAVKYENVGSIGLPATVVLTLPPEVVYDSSVPAGVPNQGNHTVTWSLPMIAPEVGDLLYVRAMVPQGTTPHTFLQAEAEIQPILGDAIPGDNHASVSQEAVAACDPNEKHVLPLGEMQPSDELRYHIDFQNVGSAEAVNIVVRDTLDANIDITTVTFGATSHTSTIAIEDRVIVWTFTDINLPYSGSDEPGSHGFAEFWARPVAEFGPGMEINNRAAIYFDFNDPVLTNWVRNFVPSPAGFDSDAAGSAGDFTLEAAGLNPGRGPFRLLLHLDSDGLVATQVFDPTGRNVRSLGLRTLGRGIRALIWDGKDQTGRNVPSGVYFVQSQLQGLLPRVATARVVVVR